SMLWKKAAYAAVCCVDAPSKSRTDVVPSGVKKTLNMLPLACITWGTPAAVSADVAARDTVAAAASAGDGGGGAGWRGSYPGGVASRNVASPAAVATGFPERVPAW